VGFMRTCLRLATIQLWVSAPCLRGVYARTGRRLSGFSPSWLISPPQQHVCGRRRADQAEEVQREMCFGHAARPAPPVRPSGRVRPVERAIAYIQIPMQGDRILRYSGQGGNSNEPTNISCVVPGLHKVQGGTGVPMYPKCSDIAVGVRYIL